MNILCISGMLPIPGYFTINDFVFVLYEYYKRHYPNDSVKFIFTVQYSNSLLEKILNNPTPYAEIRKLKKYQYQNFSVEIIPYFSIQRFLPLHAMLSFTGYWLNCRRIDKIIKNNKIDIIHSQYIIPDGTIAYMINKKYNIPYIVTSHNESKYFKHFISRQIALKILKRASFVAPINHTNFLRYKNYGLNNLKLIPLGYNESFLKLDKTGKRDFCKIISVCTLIKLKNIDKVILALSLLKDKYKFSYTIAGDGPEMENLKKLVETHHMEQIVTLLGNIPNEKIGDLLCKHDVFIMPSYFETFGRVYFEAMAVGLPIICAKNSGIFGIFKEMEEGISVNQEDITDIKEKLEILIANNDIRNKIGANGKKLVENFSWIDIPKYYHELFTKTLTER